METGLVCLIIFVSESTKSGLKPLSFPLASYGNLGKLLQSSEPLFPLICKLEKTTAYFTEF